MRIGIDLLSERGNPSGIRTYVTELLGQLVELRRERSLDLELVVFAHRDDPVALPARNDHGVEIRRTRFRSPPSFARRAIQHWALPKLTRIAEVDLVHSINNVLPAKLSVPGVVTVHDVSPFVVPERFGILKHQYLTRTVPASVRRAARTICVSRATREQVLTWIPDVCPARLVVVTQAVSDRFTADRDEEREKRLRRELSLPDRFLFHVSLIEPGKNLASVSHALKRLTDRGVDARLVVAGRETKYLKLLRKEWAKLGITNRVKYLGEVSAEALPHLYRMARGFVFPSHYEGFGLPVLEAMASGTPTITSTRSSLPEVAGRAALLAEPDDAEALAGAMEKLWKHAELRAILLGRGLARATEFTWRSTAEKTLDVYHDVLGVSTNTSDAITRAAEAVLDEAREELEPISS